MNRRLAAEIVGRKYGISKRAANGGYADEQDPEAKAALAAINQQAALQQAELDERAAASAAQDRQRRNQIKPGYLAGSPQEAAASEAALAAIEQGSKRQQAELDAARQAAFDSEVQNTRAGLLYDPREKPLDGIRRQTAAAKSRLEDTTPKTDPYVWQKAMNVNPYLAALAGGVGLGGLTYGILEAAGVKKSKFLWSLGALFGGGAAGAAMAKYLLNRIEVGRDMTPYQLRREPASGGPTKYRLASGK